MGYTHYYANQPASARVWQGFIDDVTKVLAHPDVKPHVKVSAADTTRVWINGKGKNAHEDFIIHRDGGHDCCKTARKPYDLAVATVLIVAAKRLRIRISSDGWWNEDEEWKRAAALYTSIFNYSPDCPWPLKVCVRCGKSRAASGGWGGSERCAKCGSGSSKSMNGKKTCFHCGGKRFKRPCPRDVCYSCASAPPPTP